jgi:glutamine amidotransferase
MSKKICILDYGSGNTRSVFNMISLLSNNVVISNKTADIQSASHIILPGVGAFATAMNKIRNTIPLDILQEQVFKKNKFFLGICVGMQILADKGFEFEECDGLGWIHGTVNKIEAGILPLPHIGWNDLKIIKDNPLLKGLHNNNDFYFVHSYVFRAKNKENIVAETEYNEIFNSIITQNNIFGVQFHPEKSQRTGRILLENFVNLS